MNPQRGDWLNLHIQNKAYAVACSERTNEGIRVELPPNFVEDTGIHLFGGQILGLSWRGQPEEAVEVLSLHYDPPPRITLRLLSEGPVVP